MSLAEITLVKPFCFRRKAILAIVVVFPAPFGPMNRIFTGFGLRAACAKKSWSPENKSVSASLTSLFTESLTLPRAICFPTRRLRRSSIRNSVVSRETSLSKSAMRRSSNRGLTSLSPMVTLPENSPVIFLSKPTFGAISFFSRFTSKTGFLCSRLSGSAGVCSCGSAVSTLVWCRTGWG